MDYATFYCSAFFCLIQLVRTGDIVVAKTDPPLISVIVAAVVRLRGGILINWIQDLFPEVAEALGVKEGKWVDGCLRWFRNCSLRRARCNVVLGHRTANRLIGEGILPGSIRVIHNWADDGVIRPLDKDAVDLRLLWGLHDKFVIGYSGNMGRAHEFETLLNAAQDLSSRNDIIFLFIFHGEPPLFCHWGSMSFSFLGQVKFLSLKLSRQTVSRFRRDSLSKQT